jgi:hypothetical protein
MALVLGVHVTARNTPIDPNAAEVVLACGPVGQCAPGLAATPPPEFNSVFIAVA